MFRPIIFRKVMLAGLMTATMLAGIAPANAQDRGRDRRDNGERAQRSDGGDRGVGPVGSNWRSDRSRGNGGPMAGGVVGQAQRPDQPSYRAPNMPDRRDGGRRNGRDGSQGIRDYQQDNRRDWRADGRDDRRNGQADRWNNQRDYRQDGRRNDDRGWADNRRGDDRRFDNRGRYDDRTRWNNQQRWDSGWRQDRRYDWSSYRNRYGDRYRMGRYYAPRGWDYGYRRFSVGIVLSSMLYSNNYWLDDPYAYRLPPAYGSLRWVRYYDDAILVDTRDGYVADVIHNFFW